MPSWRPCMAPPPRCPACRYQIRSIPTISGDRIYCKVLAHNAVHAAFAGYTGVTVGLVNTHVSGLSLQRPGWLAARAGVFTNLRVQPWPVPRDSAPWCIPWSHCCHPAASMPISSRLCNALRSCYSATRAGYVAPTSLTHQRRRMLTLCMHLASPCLPAVLLPAHPHCHLSTPPRGPPRQDMEQAARVNR